MTKNQIDYWNLQELKRSNMARESETASHNREMEQQGRAGLAESKRHSLATESEATRHNYQTEALGSQDLLERSRSNRANEANTRQRNAIEANKVSETQRSNMANESIGRSNATTNLLGARAKGVEASTNAGNLIVRQRAQEETERSNRAQEMLKSEEIGARTASDIVGTLGNFFGRVLGRRSTYGQ